MISINDGVCLFRLEYVTKLIEFQRLFFSNENLVNINFYSELSGKISELSDSVKQLRLMSSIEFLSSD